MSVGYILLLKIYENWCFIDLCFLGFQQNHYNFACLLLWGLHFCNPIEHCALARSSTHMRPLILASPIVKFSLCKESLVRIGEVFHNSSKSSQNILLQYKRHSSPRRLAGEKKCDSYNHKTTIWVSHEYYLNPEFHKILSRAFWVIAILRFSPYVARVDFKGLISK